MADRAGRLEDRPQRIKVEVLPYDNCDIETLLDSLEDLPDPFVKRYEVGGKRYIQVISAPAHFNPHPNEKHSEIPACSKKLLPKAKALHPKVKALQPLDGALALNPLSLNPHSLNPDNTLAQAPKPKQFVKPTPQEVKAYAISIGFRLDGERFCAYYESNGWKVGRNPMRNWEAAVVTWKKGADPAALIPLPRPFEALPKPEDRVSHDAIKGLLATMGKEMHK